MYKQDNLTIHNEDCMKIMEQYEDNYFDLAVVDPPYGIGIDGQKESIKGKKSDRKKHIEKGWDSEPPTKSYFDELHRVSKNCIIWGANYFLHALTENHKGWMIWDKAQHGLTMSDCELAYSTFDKPTRIFTQNRCVLRIEGTIHPTQKPVKLYNWIYKNYAQEGQKILDTHLGSGSNAISAHYAKMGEFVGCELDKDYYEASIKRIHNETRQLELF